MTFFIIIIVLFVGLIIYSIATSDTKPAMKILHDLGLQWTDLLPCGKYVTGHPDINMPFPNIKYQCIDGKIYFFSPYITSDFKVIGIIPMTSVKNILLEDASSMERRVTLARLALVGIFAFGIKKKKKTELAYITIEWNDGRFDHSTILEFADKGCMGIATTLKNRLMNEIKAYEKQS